jgi:hypothetical protein
MRPVPAADDAAQDRTEGIPATHGRVPVLRLRLDRENQMARRATPSAKGTPGIASAMADSKSLRLIGYGLSAVALLVTIVAAVLVVGTTRGIMELPTVHAAM